MRNTIIGKKKNEGFCIEWINPIWRYREAIFNVEFNQPCNPIASNFYAIAGDGMAFNIPSEASISITSISSDYTQCQVKISGMSRDGDVILAINNGALLSTSNIPLSGGNMANGTRYESEIPYSYTLVPQIIQYYPSDGSSYSLLPYSNFTLTFNQNIRRGSSGWIKLWDSSTNPATLLQNIQYNDDSRIIINNNVVEIKHNDLLDIRSYYVTIDNNVLKSTYSGVAFPGINDTTTWNFTTPFVAPVSVTNLRRITNNKSSITIAYDKRTYAKVLILAKMGGTGTAHNEGNPLTNYNDPSFNTTNAGADATNALITNVNTLTTGGLTNYVKVYAGNAGQVIITGITANTWVRFYVISYAEQDGIFKFSTDVVTLDCKTNKF